jgi:hypothetical protein
MNITVLNGDMGGVKSDFSNRLQALFGLSEQNSRTTVFPLAEMKLHYCIGCWDCWWKTPGR